MKPVWEKLTEVKPGLYWTGGNCDKPSRHPWVTCVSQGIVTSPHWYARIGNVPPPPEVARPDLKVDDKVLVRDIESSDWRPAHFHSWSIINGNIKTWAYGNTSWSSVTKHTATWIHWKLPDEE